MSTETRTGEKRSGVRYPIKASIVYAPFNTSNYKEAEVVNVSDMGMSFRSGAPLKSGAFIYIRMAKYSPMISHIDAEIRTRSVALAEVKWCRQLIGQSETPFEIGVIYLFPG